MLRPHGFTGLAPVNIDGKWGHINTKGTFVINAKYEGAKGFGANGLATVKQNGKWGAIDNTGKLVIPAEFRKVSTTTNTPRLNLEI